MRVLIFTAGVGSGHNQVAKTLRDSILKTQPHSEVQMLDVLTTISPFLSKVMLDSYLAMLRHTPGVWGILHDQLDSDNFRGEPLNLMNRLLSRHLRKYIANYQPDIIVNTHPFASNIMGTLRQHGQIDCPVVTVITDYNIHSYWVHKGVDRFYTAAQLLRPLLQTLSIPNERIMCYGIPVRQQFVDIATETINSTRKKLNIADKPTMLFMGGGLGLGDITEVLAYTDDVINNTQIIVVCGKNQELYETLEHARWHNDIILMKYVENIAEIMHASDIIVTKPGGVTSTEALCLGKPMVLISPIPGQETRNQEFFLNRGVAVSVPTNSFAGYIIKDLLNDPERRDIMGILAKKIANINASNDIVNDWNQLLLKTSLDTYHNR